MTVEHPAHARGKITQGRTGIMGPRLILRAFAEHGGLDWTHLFKEGVGHFADQR